MSVKCLFVEFEVDSDNDEEEPYLVAYDPDDGWYCNCPDYYYRKKFCKHMQQVAKAHNIRDIKVFKGV